MSTDELTTEHEYVDHAYRSLVDMRARTQRVFDRIMETGGFQELDHEIALRRRIAALGDSPRPLLFGRIDEDDGDRWYIGRRHVETEAGDEVVIEWRTPVAEPFYRAGAGDPMGLVRRRQLMVENHQLVSFADDVFDDDAGEPGELRLRGGDALLAELERARTGEMLDIVATIQVEQDEVIRAPLPGVLAVQGGPGSGKTAIGLHRAAFLLFNHRELARAEGALSAAGIVHGVAERDGLGKQVTLLAAPEAKGLEFDAVVVVEPAAIAGDTARGLRLLYVALTRPIQHLSIVHARPLPAALSDPES